MASFDYSNLRAEARNALDRQADTAKRLVMIHSGVVIGLGLVLSVLSYLLNMGIEETGGLGGISTRAVLETLQTVLSFANLVLIPFWTLGYTYMILSVSQGTPVGTSSLFWGFQHWGVVLRSLLLQGVVYFVLAMVGAQIAGVVFMMSPASRSLLELVEEMMAAGVTDPYAMLDEQTYLALGMQMLPFVLVGMLVLIVPVFYRLRFTDFALARNPEQGAIRAMLTSFRLTRKQSLAIFKLDLRFWWFYLAQLLIAALGYGDQLLPILGVNLGIGADAAMFLFYTAGLVCEFGLYVWLKNQVSGTYALAYDQLSTTEPEIAQ